MQTVRQQGMPSDTRAGSHTLTESRLAKQVPTSHGRRSGTTSRMSDKPTPCTGKAARQAAYSPEESARRRHPRGVRVTRAWVTGQGRSPLLSTPNCTKSTPAIVCCLYMYYSQKYCLLLVVFSAVCCSAMVSHQTARHRQDLEEDPAHRRLITRFQGSSHPSNDGITLWGIAKDTVRPNGGTGCPTKEKHKREADCFCFATSHPPSSVTRNGATRAEERRHNTY
jgi:hypothetical protein